MKQYDDSVFKYFITNFGSRISVPLKEFLSLHDYLLPMLQEITYFFVTSGTPTMNSDVIHFFYTAEMNAAGTGGKRSKIIN
jgi:hypothetical protein